MACGGPDRAEGAVVLSMHNDECSRGRIPCVGHQSGAFRSERAKLGWMAYELPVSLGDGGGVSQRSAWSEICSKSEISFV